MTKMGTNCIGMLFELLCVDVRARVWVTIAVARLKAEWINMQGEKK